MTTEKKYEILKEDCLLHNGRRLFRIKALKDFGIVKKGEIGGYIENEDNLSQQDNCWIFNNAKVFSEAKVRDNALVFDKSMVFDTAIIEDNTLVCDHSKIYGSAKIKGNARINEHSEVFEEAIIMDNAYLYDNAKVYGNSLVECNATLGRGAEVFGNSLITGNAQIMGERKGEIIKVKDITLLGILNTPYYKKVFNIQSTEGKSKILTAILTTNNQILYNILFYSDLKTKESLLKKINNDTDPENKKYIELIEISESYLKKYMD